MTQAAMTQAAMTLVLLVSQDAAQELTCLNARSGTVRWVPTQRRSEVQSPAQGHQLVSGRTGI